MHFFRIFPHEIFKDSLKVLNKKLKFGQKISLDFCLYTPSKCPTKNSPACKNKKKLVQKSNIFYVDQGVKSRFPFISKIGGSIKYSCHSLISELSFSTFNLICGFAQSHDLTPGYVFIGPGSALALSSSKKSEKVTKLSPKSCMKTPKTM